MVQVHSSRPNSLPRIMHGKYREILALATPTAASKTTSKLLPWCYYSCYYFRLIWSARSARSGRSNEFSSSSAENRPSRGLEHTFLTTHDKNWSVADFLLMVELCLEERLTHCPMDRRKHLRGVSPF
jgi:hypothetical protein